MLKTVISSRALIPLSLVLAAGTGLLTAAPAYAGERDRAATSTAKTFKAQQKRTSQTRSTRGVRVAAGDVNGRRSARSGNGGGGIFNNGGTFAREQRATNRAFTGGINVSAGDVNGVRSTRKKGKLSQNGTTVATANEVQAPQSTPAILTPLLLPAVQKASDTKPTSPKGKPFRQEPGTTVPSADDVQAPQEETRTARAGSSGGPKVKVFDGKAPAARGKLNQNGTTVETANEVQAPQDEQQVGLLLPAVQKVREAAPRSGGK